MWSNIIIGIGLFGIGIAVVFIIGIIKRGQYEQDSKGKIMSEIRTETGWPLRKVVTPFPDGWVRVGKGDYMLPRVKKDGDDGSAESVDALVGVTAGEAQIVRQREQGSQPAIATVKTIITEWDRYPSSPWMGMKWTQVPIRKQSWWENNPEPIVRPKYRIEATAADAQAHTREMDAMNVGIRIQESEARQKQFMEALSNQPNKMLVYILLGANIIATVIGVAVAMGKIGG